jgi:hypothetical protein
MNYLTRLGSIALCAVSFAVAGCQTTTTNSHQFSQPSAGWTTKTGQLAYKDQKLSLIGEVLVRYSKQGDFELTFTKAGGITLLSLRQDAGFGKAEGPMARRGWAGPLPEAPTHLRGWFQLRDKIVNGRSGATIRHDAGEQTFTVRF